MANENYIKSEDIQMYPSAYRGVNENTKFYNPTSYLNTEENITGLICRLTDAVNGCFILKATNNSGSKPIEICLKGYWFKFDLENIPLFKTNGTKPLWAQIRVDSITVPETETTQKYNLNDLYPYDSTLASKRSLDYSLPIDTNGNTEDKFIGLNFTQSEPNNVDNEYSLKIWDGSGFPSESFIKFKEEIVNQLTLSSLSNSETKNYAVISNSDGKLLSTDLTVSAPDATAETNSEWTYVESVTSDSTGKISVNRKKVKDANLNSLKLGNLSASQGLVTDADKKLVSKDLTVSAPDATAETNSEWTYVDSWSSDSDGTITTTRKKSKIETGDNQGSFKVNSSTINIKDLQSDSSPTFSGLTISSLKEKQDNSLCVDSNGKLSSISLKQDDPVSSGESLSFINTLSQAANGKITATKNSISFTNSTTQGSFKVNNTDESVYGLSTTDSPSFKSITLTENKVIGSNSNEFKLPSKSGKLATVDYDSDSNTLTINI